MPEEQPLLPKNEVGALIAAEERLSTWAKNQTELAEAIGCNRKSIQRWLKEAHPDCPGQTSDGRYNITLWKLFVESVGKKVRAIGKGRNGQPVNRVLHPQLQESHHHDTSR